MGTFDGDKEQYQTSSLDAARLAMAAMMAAKLPLCVVGPASSGKTESIRQLVDAMPDHNLVEVDGSMINRVESMACLRVRDDGYVESVPHIRFRPAIMEPAVVLMDEVNRAQQGGPLATLEPLFKEHRLDQVQLHADSFVVGTMNPEGMGAATKRLGWTFVSRLGFVWYEPSRVDQQNLETLGYPAPPVTYDEAKATAEELRLIYLKRQYVSATPDSVLQAPPDGWRGAPIQTTRGWNMAVKGLAHLRALDITPDDLVGSGTVASVTADAERTVVAGFCGPKMAQGFLTWERAVKQVDPANVLTEQSNWLTSGQRRVTQMPVLTGAQGKGWVALFLDTAKIRPDWAVAAASLVGDLCRNFGADLLARPVADFNVWLDTNGGDHDGALLDMDQFRMAKNHIDEGQLVISSLITGVLVGS